MARHQYKFTIIHRCGHPGNHSSTYDLMPGCKVRLRAQDCDECRRAKGGGEVIWVDGKESTLPPIIIGSDAQILWAVKIRRKVLTALLKARQEGDPNPVDWMWNQINAKWWIDRRALSPVDLVRTYPKAA